MSASVPHLLVTVLLQRWLPVALLPLCSLLLFLFGLGGQHELLRYLLLGDELGDGARLPGGGRDMKPGWGGQVNASANHCEHVALC